MSALQEIPTRAFGSGGNRAAGEYLYARLTDIPGLEVEFQGGCLNNVIATLPGSANTSDEVVMVGAHYDSTSSDLARAPGATDNGCGVAIVLELARVMSGHSFDRTVRFALWNAEEDGCYGSIDYVEHAARSSDPITLYINFDSTCYDPENRSVLDIIYDERSADIAALMIDHNTIYATNFTLTTNVHTCESDHTSFQVRGFPAVTTHSEEHGPAHTPEDTIDHVSFDYARRNARNRPLGADRGGRPSGRRWCRHHLEGPDRQVGYAAAQPERDITTFLLIPTPPLDGWPPQMWLQRPTGTMSGAPGWRRAPP